MKAQAFASHLFSATFLLVGLALVVGACSSKTKPGATESTGSEAVRPVVQRYRDIGVRVEDSFLLTEDGLENLSKTVPRTVEEIESFMAGS